MRTKKPKPEIIISSPEEPTLEKVVSHEIQDYKNFAFNKNMMSVAIGLIMATAFQKTVTGVSDYLIMPIVNYLAGKTGDDWRKWVIHPVNGMNIELGHLLGTILDFVILTIVLYFIYQFILKRICPDLTVGQPNPLAPNQPIVPTTSVQNKKNEKNHSNIQNWPDLRVSHAWVESLGFVLQPRPTNHFYAETVYKRGDLTLLYYGPLSMWSFKDEKTTDYITMEHILKRVEASDNPC